MLGRHLTAVEFYSVIMQDLTPPCCGEVSDRLEIMEFREFATAYSKIASHVMQKNLIG